MTKRASFLGKSAEQIVDEKHVEAPPVVAQTGVDSEGQEPEPGDELHKEHDRLMGMRYDPEYVARNRAKVLLSTEVTREYSPSERLTLIVPEGCPWAYRWCDPTHRHRVGMGPWVAVMDEDEAKQLSVSKTVMKGEDGKMYAGGLFLAKAPLEEIEKYRALHYQRSQRMLQAAVRGQATASVHTEDGTEKAGFETFSQINKRTARGGDKGIRMTGKLVEED